MTWPTFNLRDVCEFQNGFAFKSKLFTEKGMPILRISNIQNGSIDLKRIVYTDPNAYKEVLDKYRVVSNDLLIAMSGATTGKIGINQTDSVFLLNQRVGKFIPGDSLDKLYLYYCLSTKVEEHLEISAGAAQPNLSTEQIKGMEIPLPPIPEQKRIVAILDQAFADIEQARAKTEQNLKNARELYLSKKSAIFVNLQASSRIMPLPSVCDNIFAGGDAPKKGLYSKFKTDQFQIPIYANAVKNNGLYGFTDYSRADKPSISIAARGSGTGHIELRREAFLPIVRLIVLTPDQEIISLEYLKHALQNLDILRSGSAIPQLTVPMIKGYSIPIPSLKEQQELIEELKELELFINQVKKIYLDKIELLDELKKSILHLAFSGELTKAPDKETKTGVAP